MAASTRLQAMCSLFAVLAICGCSGTPSQPAMVPSAQAVTKEFQLVVTEANVALRSGSGPSCVILQSDGSARIVGEAVARWSTRMPNPEALRFGWYDDEHAAPPPSVTGPSPLSIAFESIVKDVEDPLRIFVGGTEDSRIVYDQPVTVTLNVTYEGDPVEMYRSACTVN